MPRSPRKRREAAAGAETAALQKQNKQKKHIEKLETRETHSWLDAVWGLAPRSGLALVASRDAAARDACARGALEVSRSGGRASATRLFHAYPLRLICPRRAGVERASGADCVWCYQVSFGGGLVAGDRAGASVDVADGCACVLATQGTNKVYKHVVARRDASDAATAATENGTDRGTDSKNSFSRRETTQALAGRVGAGALLACLPDPTQAFRDARFRQTQRFLLHPTASLVSVDWLVPGAAFRRRRRRRLRLARGGGGHTRDGRASHGGPRAGRAVVFRILPRGHGGFRGARARSTRDRRRPGRSRRRRSRRFFRGGVRGGVSAGGRPRGRAREENGRHARAGDGDPPRPAVRGGGTARASPSTRAAAAATVAGGAKRVFANHSGPLETQNSLGDSGDSQKKSWLLCSVSPVPAPLGCDEADGGGIVLRVAGSSTDLVYATLREALAPLADELGAAPYAERGLS